MITLLQSPQAQTRCSQSIVCYPERWTMPVYDLRISCLKEAVHADKQGQLSRGGVAVPGLACVRMRVGRKGCSEGCMRDGEGAACCCWGRPPWGCPWEPCCTCTAGMTPTDRTQSHASEEVKSYGALVDSPYVGSTKHEEL